MCNYNFAQVKFNQSPEHKELAVSQEKEEEGTERERKEGGARERRRERGGEGAPLRAQAAAGVSGVSDRSTQSAVAARPVARAGLSAGDGEADTRSLLGAQNHALCFVLK